MALKHPRVAAQDRALGVSSEGTSRTVGLRLPSALETKLAGLHQFIEEAFPGEIKAGEANCIPAATRLIKQLDVLR